MNKVFGLDCFGKNISQLLLSATMNNFKYSILNLVSQKIEFMSMCLLLPCGTGFLVRPIADLLSIINFTCLLTLIFISCNKFRIKTAWQADKAHAMYSASQVDNATTSYFLEHQEMGPPKYLKKYSEVLLMSTLSPHQSDS